MSEVSLRLRELSKVHHHAVANLINKFALGQGTESLALACH